MISLNTNMASSWAAYTLNNNNVSLQRSLNKLSSGQRINSSYDDSGGLAVSMKMSASIRRSQATVATINNAISSLQTQDGVLKSAEGILNRMSELTQLAADVSKSTDDKNLYQTEYNSLTQSLVSLTAEEFNGTAMFSTNGNTLSVVASEDGSQTIGITQANLEGIYINNSLSNINLANSSLITSAISSLTTAIQDLAELRAKNGSEQMRLTFAVDMLAINQNNTQAANSRIQDVDLASESANRAKLSIINEAGMAMASQANQSNAVVLKLLE